jgi:tetratricopeptide (TPR) repeat protein
LGLNETVERSAVLYGLWTIRNTGAEHESALALAAENRGFAKEQGDAVLQSVVGRSFGWTQIMCGQFVEATGSLERALSSFGEGYRLDLAARFVHEPKLIAEACLPMPLWILGFPSKAWHQVEEVMENARKTNHEFTLVWTIAMAGLIAATWLHRLDHTKRWASEVAERSDTGGFGFFVQFSKIFGSWADVALGSSHSTIELESAIDVIHQKDVWLFTPLFLCCLADSHRRCGRGELAIRSVDAALAFSQRTGERMMDAELHRIKGECLATTGDYPAAQHSYRLAIDIARAQHAKSWELRAATSLARLWQSQSKTQQAQDLLAPIYNWFTEGFDTSDLKEAKSLLEELKQA